MLRVVLVLLLLGFIVVEPVEAQIAGAERVGEVRMDNSGAPEAQAPFLRGLGLLHNFEYEDARVAFREARRRDPAFALAYWGEALTYDYPLWNEEALDSARAVLALFAPTPELRVVRAGSPREGRLLHAVNLLFGEGNKAARDSAYADALAELHEAEPADPEIATLYALAIMGTAEDGRDFSKYMRAAAVLEEVIDRHPRHPGAVHYLIHAYDDPMHAPLGLRLARVYADIAPDAVHALHMPSHIFFAMGMWEDAVAANRRSWQASVDRAHRLGLGPGAYSFHALEWLHYAQLQLGRFNAAAEVLNRAEEALEEAPSGRIRWYVARMRAAHLLTDTEGSGALVPLLRDTTGVSPAGRASAVFALAYHDFLSGDISAVGPAAAELAVLADQLDRSDVRIMRDQMAALQRLEQGDTAAAVSDLESLAELEFSLPYEFGPPPVLKPTYEILGDIMAEKGSYARARAYYRIREEEPEPGAVIVAEMIAGAGRAATQGRRHHPIPLRRRG